MNIVIVGLGVIGGSFAQALQKAGYTSVYGIDTDETTLHMAERMGIIRAGSTRAERFLPQADLTILAIYPHSIQGFLQAHRTHFKKGSILTDVTGIKSALARNMAAMLPEGVDFVLGHPMAGREKKGIAFADAQVFQGANYLITPVETNREENIVQIENLARTLGFRSVRRISPALHDEMIAFTSQLPHVLAVALMNSDDPDRETGQFIGDSFRDLTRIANINGALWAELFLENKPGLLKAISNFEEQLKILKTAIAENDRDTLLKQFAESSQRREALER